MAPSPKPVPIRADYNTDLKPISAEEIPLEIDSLNKRHAALVEMQNRAVNAENPQIGNATHEANEHERLMNEHLHALSKRGLNVTWNANKNTYEQTASVQVVSTVSPPAPAPAAVPQTPPPSLAPLKDAIEHGQILMRGQPNHGQPTKATIQSAQEFLNWDDRVNHGGKHQIKVDGVIGGETERAIRGFQTACGALAHPTNPKDPRAVDGKIGKITFSHMELLANDVKPLSTPKPLAEASGQKR